MGGGRSRTHPPRSSVRYSTAVPRHTDHPADTLLEAVDRLGAPVCVGLDPVRERLPEALRRRGDDVGALRDFGLAVLDAVAAHVPCVKLQSACFERYGHDGVAALETLVAAARARKLVVILDAKRGDMALSARHYAAAAFPEEPAARADWITINGYLGADGIMPFVEAGGGAFVLVRTSNPGGDAVQSLRLADGRTVAEAVADLVAATGHGTVGARGYSALGAVVGATKAADAAALRARMPEQIFLVPGYGAQGGGADDVRSCFDGAGRGAIVTASRSVIYPEGADDSDWASRVGDAARRLADDIGRVAGVR